MDKADIRVDKAVLHKTTHCMNDFSCLSGEKTCLCDVLASNGEDIIEITPQPSRSCKYRISLETASFCHCPTRVEIYNRYKI